MSKPDLDVALSDRISRQSGGGGGGRRGGTRGRSGPARRDRASRPTPYSRGSRVPPTPYSRSSSSGSLGATTISISNLLPSVDEGDLKEIFGTMGTIIRAVVHYDRAGRSQGTAEVTFGRSQDAEQAVKEYDAAEVDGRPMYLKMIVSRAAVTALQRPSGGVSDQKCYNCNRRGHIAAECNSRGRDQGRTERGNVACFECGESGHIARQCPKNGEGKESREGGECYVCHKTGHFARSCPDALPGSKGGRRRGADDKPPKAEDLDADMEDYFKKKSSEEASTPAAPAPAAPAVVAAE